MLDEALPNLKERTAVKQMNTDGGYNSPDVDKTMRKLGVEQVQSAIRGRKPSEEKLGLEDFDWELGTDGEPQESKLCDPGVYPGFRICPPDTEDEEHLGSRSVPHGI